MPAKTVTCIICNQEVTKRSTLSAKPLTNKDNRVCRSHEMADEILGTMEEGKAEIAREKRIERGVRNLQVISSSAFIRMMHSMYEVPVERLYARLMLAGYDRAFIDEVKEEVVKQGGPLMSDREQTDAVMTAVAMQKHGILALS